jgi:hypothetical protein
MNPSPEQIAKLPVWAREHITNLARQRETAVRELNQWVDTQTVAPFYIDELVCTGEQASPSFKKRYIQTHKMEVEHLGVVLAIYLGRDGIELSWSGPHRGGAVGLIPQSHQRIELVAKEKMRD